MSDPEQKAITGKVLIVDDTDHVRNMLADMLELDGFEVVGQAQSGREAIDLRDEVRPDVVVMDYRMEDIDGLTAAREIRLTNPTQAIILYSAFLDDDLQEAARRAGIAACVSKFDGINQLERQIADLLRNSI